MRTLERKVISTTKTGMSAIAKGQINGQATYNAIKKHNEKLRRDAEKKARLAARF